MLDPQQSHARTLTSRAEPLWFRIHNTVLRLFPIDFDDLPEMTQWFNRAKFYDDRVIHDKRGRVLCSLRWLMSEAGKERFLGMKDMLLKAIRQCDQKATTGTTCDLEYANHSSPIPLHQSLNNSAIHEPGQFTRCTATRSLICANFLSLSFSLFIFCITGTSSTVTM